MGRVLKLLRIVVLYAVFMFVALVISGPLVDRMSDNIFVVFVFTFPAVLVWRSELLISRQSVAEQKGSPSRAEADTYSGHLSRKKDAKGANKSGMPIRQSARVDTHQSRKRFAKLIRQSATVDNVLPPARSAEPARSSSSEDTIQTRRRFAKSVRQSSAVGALKPLRSIWKSAPRSATSLEASPYLSRELLELDALASRVDANSVEAVCKRICAA